MPNREAAEEFESKYNEPAGNAEKVIKARRDAFTRELREASLANIDAVATQALDLDKVAKAVKDDGELRAASVRGRWVVAVVADTDNAGRTAKVVFDSNDVLSDAEIEAVEENLPVNPQQQPKQVKPPKAPAQRSGKKKS